MLVLTASLMDYERKVLMENALVYSYVLIFQSSPWPTATVFMAPGWIMAVQALEELGRRS